MQHTFLLRLILYTTQIQFPLSLFVFIDSFVVSVLQDAGGYAISRENNLELHLGYHTCWLSYLTLVCLWCVRTFSRAVFRSRDYQIFSDGQITSFTYPWCSAGALRARELRYKGAARTGRGLWAPGLIRFFCFFVGMGTINRQRLLLAHKGSIISVRVKVRRDVDVEKWRGWRHEVC